MLGSKRIKSLSYKESNLKNEIKNKNNDSKVIHELDKLNINTFIECSKLKFILQDIYNKLGLKKTAKATDITRYYVNSILVSKRINGKKYYTWNPIKGKCLHDCSYCYMKTIPQYQHLLLAENEFKTDLGNGNRIFIGSSTDAFAEDVPSEWIVRILDYCYQNHNAEAPNAYLLQSKNPKRFLEFIDHPIMERVIFCTTIETNRFYPEIMNKAPRIEERVEAMEEIARLGRPTMITAEPLMQFDHEEMVSFIRRCSPKLVNIGKESKGRVKLPEPTQEEVQQLIAELKSFANVNVKDNALIWRK